MRKRRRIVRLTWEQLDSRSLPSGYSVAQLTNAYGINSIHFTSSSGAVIAGNGSGETIALVEAYHDPTLASDLDVFDQANGLTDPSLTVVDQAGSKTNATWASEESLDVEWAHAIAPGANILVVEAGSANLSDLLKAVDTARYTPGVASISMSWGFTETSGETAYDAHFQTPAGHQGITFVAGSGDDGTGAGPEYPASSPDVLAVGGTTLSTDPAGDYLSETAWIDSGGGFSSHEPEPSYQEAIQTTGKRSTPDIAFDGDPSTGVEVYQTPINAQEGVWMTVGGTSLGAPAWAALIAIVDQGRALENKGSLDGPTQTLPALYSLPSTDFHPVAIPPPYSPWGGGINPVGSPSHGRDFLRRRGKKAAGSSIGSTGETNIVTGLGSPVAPQLVADLVASDLTRPLSTAPAPANPDGRASIRSSHHRAKSSSPHRST